MIDHISATMVIAYVFIFTIAPSHPNKQRRADKDTYYHTHVSSRENTFHDTWGSSIAIAYFFIIVLSTLAYPYSSQNYIIALIFGVAALFLQLIVIDECRLHPVKDRLSVPDLIAGIIFFLIAFLCFVLDSWLYWLPHSLWHAFVNVGLFFYFAGLTKNHPLHYSPILLLWRALTTCCR
jgi:predicted membrane channel-forming protein YqfA (hemolysin III family)